LCETLQSPNTNLCAYTDADILKLLEIKAKGDHITSKIAQKQTLMRVSRLNPSKELLKNNP
jgi:hypothetical protein